MLDLNDFQNLLRVVRRSTPDSFEEGKDLVVLEGKLIQVLQSAEQAQFEQRVAALAEDADVNVPSSD